MNPGSGVVGVSLQAGRSVVDTVAARSPLRLLTPRNHGHAAWVFAASLGGGLVDGDRLDLRVSVGAGAAALVGTQAQTKVYRSAPSGGCRQDTHASVGDGALLVLLPDPVACFAGARYGQSMRVSLAPTGSALIVDPMTAGRAAAGERWAFAGVRTRTVVERGGRDLLYDGLLLDPAHGAVAARMGRFDAMATIIAVGPALAAVRATLLAFAPELEPEADVIAASAAIADDAVVLRLLCRDAEVLGRATRTALSDLAALLGDDPHARKW